MSLARRGYVLLVAMLVAAAACGGPPPATGSPVPVTPAAAAARDTPPRDAADAALVPPGLGTLKQEDISIVLEANGVRIAAIPLDESVIRTLAPDSYRSLHSRVEENRRVIAQRASMHAIRDPRVWYVRYDGLMPDARFVPTDLTVTSGGRDFRPVDVVPLTSGFGEERLQPRETQRGLLIFEEGVDVAQPLVVSVGTVRNADWDLGSGGILRKLDTERSSIRGRTTPHTEPPSRPR